MKKRPRTRPAKVLPRKGGIPLKVILDLYDAFLREPQLNKVANALEMQPATLTRWLNQYPDLLQAKQLADTRRGVNSTLPKYIYQHLTPEVRATWDALMFWDGHNSFDQKVNELLSHKPTRLKQELFVHALVHFCFDLSKACRVTGISRMTLQTWKSDLDFLQMLEEIEFHKKNFFEKALLELVEIRHPGATIFVNQTKNADRGYNPKIQVEHSGSVTDGYSMEDLAPYLSLDAKREIREAIRQKRAQEAHNENTVPQLEVAV